MFADITGDKILIFDSFKEKESIKLIEGRFFDRDKKAWIIPFTSENRALLTMLGCQFREDVVLDREINLPINTVNAKAKYLLPINVKPYSHQIAAFNFAVESLETHPGVALLMEMGTGKTLVSIAIIGHLAKKRNIKRVLIISPLSIVDVWKNEFSKFADFDYTLSVLDGDTSKKAQILKKETDKLCIVVINYESVWRLERELKSYFADVIICDESTKIKNAMAKQSKAIHKLGKAAKYKLILSGTPVTNSPCDLFSQYKFLDDSIFGESYYGFRSRYIIMGGFNNKQIMGYRNIEELTRKAHEVAYRIKLKDSVELPSVIDEVRYLTLEPEAKAIYSSVDKDSYAKLIGGELIASNVLTRLLRLSQITGGFVRDDESKTIEQVSNAKLDALEDILEQALSEDKKVVIFARFIPEIEAIEKLLKRRIIDYAIVKGDIKNRGEQVEKFQSDSTCKVFVGQLQTCGMGLTLIAGSIAVYYSLDFSYSNYEQSRARIHRIGQDKHCVYIHLVAKNTVDEKVMEALKAKADISRLLIDDYKKLFYKGKGENDNK